MCCSPALFCVSRIRTITANFQRHVSTLLYPAAKCNETFSRCNKLRKTGIARNSPKKYKKGLLRPVCSSARRKPAAKVEGFASSVTTPFLERASEKFQGKALISWPGNKIFTPRKCQKFFRFTQQTLSSAKWTLISIAVMKRLESPRPISELFGWKLEDRRVM